MNADQNGSNFPRLVEVMRRLLAPGGCPWDREQTFESLRAYVIEEAYEVVEAIDRGDHDSMCEELGDLLLQVVFHAELARAGGRFGPDDVIDGICEKLIRRHPHVFGSVDIRTAGEVLTNWEKIKAADNRDRGILDGLPVSLPALLRAKRIGEKAARVGFDWPDQRGAREKVSEELREFDEAFASGDEEAAERELGDVLFAMANLARKRGFDPEAALRATLQRFADRMRRVEDAARRQGRALREMTPDELDANWEAAKRGETPGSR